ncbi:hypothetical protein FRC11_005500, partial [Ceratobasidium sp. 423]
HWCAALLDSALLPELSDKLLQLDKPGELDELDNPNWLELEELSKDKLDELLDELELEQSHFLCFLLFFLFSLLSLILAAAFPALSSLETWSVSLLSEATLTK